MIIILEWFMFLLFILVVIMWIAFYWDNNCNFNAKKMRNKSDDYSYEIEDIQDQIEIAARYHKYEIEISNPGEKVIDYFSNKGFEIIESSDDYNIIIKWENKNSNK